MRSCPRYERTEYCADQADELPDHDLNLLGERRAPGVSYKRSLAISQLCIKRNLRPRSMTLSGGRPVIQ